MAISEALPVRISFYGVGCKVLVGRFSEVVWDRLNSTAKMLNSSLTDAVFDPSFYEGLKNLRIRSINDLGKQIKVYGLIQSNHSVVEFQAYRKRKRTVRFEEVISSPTLFPLFQKEVKKYSIVEAPRTLLVVEKEIGLINYYKLEVDAFSLERFKFEVSEITLASTGWQLEMISAIYYDGVLLKSFGDNALVSEQFAVNCWHE